MVKCFVSGDLPFLPPYTWLIIVLKTGKVFQSCITLIEVRDHSAAGLKVNEIPWTSHFSKLSPQSSEWETRFWITKTAFPPPAWTPPALHSLAHCFPVFCKAVPISADGESQCFGRVMWLCPSLSRKRTDGSLCLGLSGKLPSKTQSHFLSVPPLYFCVCFTVAQQRCPEIRVTELVFLSRHKELCLHVLNKRWKLLSFVSLYKHKPFLSQNRWKKILEMLFLCLPLARRCDLGRFCDSCVFVTEQQQEKERRSLLACSFSLFA